MPSLPEAASFGRPPIQRFCTFWGNERKWRKGGRTMTWEKGEGQGRKSEGEKKRHQEIKTRCTGHNVGIYWSHVSFFFTFPLRTTEELRSIFLNFLSLQHHYRDLLANRCHINCKCTESTLNCAKTMKQVNTWSPMLNNCKKKSLLYNFCLVLTQPCLASRACLNMKGDFITEHFHHHGFVLPNEMS